MAQVAQDGAGTLTTATDDPAANSTSGQKKSAALALSNVPPLPVTPGASAQPAGAAPVPSFTPPATPAATSVAPAPSTLPAAAPLPLTPPATPPGGAPGAAPQGPATGAAVATPPTTPPATPPATPPGGSQSPFPVSTPIAGLPNTALQNPFDPAAWAARGGTALTVDQSNAMADPYNADQANIDRINGANGAYNAGGTWDGTDAGRITINGLNQGTPWDPTTGTFHGTPGTGTTPGFGVALNGDPLRPGTVLPQDAVDHTPAGGAFGIPGGPSDVGSGGSTGAPSGDPLLPGIVGGATGKPPAAQGSNPGLTDWMDHAPAVSTAPTLTKTDPNNPLTANTISVDPAANRFDIANRQLKDTITNTLDPQYAADARKISELSFGAGRGVSGQNRTSLGDLALREQNNENQLASTFMNNALSGTIDDQYKSAGIAQQQQGFQSQQEQNAFNEQVTQKQLEDQLTNSATSRAAVQNSVGSSNSLAQAQLIVSQMQNGNAAAAGQAAVQALTQAGIDASKMTPEQAVAAYLKVMGMNPPTSK